MNSIRIPAVIDGAAIRMTPTVHAGAVITAYVTRQTFSPIPFTFILPADFNATDFATQDFA